MIYDSINFSVVLDKGIGKIVDINPAIDLYNYSIASSNGESDTGRTDDMVEAVHQESDQEYAEIVTNSRVELDETGKLMLEQQSGMDQSVRIVIEEQETVELECPQAEDMEVEITLPCPGEGVIQGSQCTNPNKNCDKQTLSRKCRFHLQEYKNRNARENRKKQNTKTNKIYVDLCNQCTKLPVRQYCVDCKKKYNRICRRRSRLAAKKLDISNISKLVYFTYIIS